MSDANTVLMLSIHQHFGGAITEACKLSNAAPGFLAALIANESGGKNEAIRFESSVFEHLKQVLLGTRKNYSPAGIRRPITAADLSAYCDPGVGEERGNFSAALQQLHNLATSWGLTQIMGWHLVEFQSGMGVGWLATPGGNLNFSTKLAAWFAEHYQLDLSADFADLFHCWNTGVPGGDPNHPTFDPNYVPNGLLRMQLYADILANETDPGT